MTHRRSIHSTPFVTAMLLLGIFATSFIRSESHSRKAYVPFILQLSSSGADKVTPILDSTKSVQMMSGFVSLQPGENVGSHNTGEHEELLVILSGSGRVEARGLGREKVSQGMVVYVPPNNQHNVYCTGSSPLQYIYIVSRVK